MRLETDRLFRHTESAESGGYPICALYQLNQSMQHFEFQLWGKPELPRGLDSFPDSVASIGSLCNAAIMFCHFSPVHITLGLNRNISNALLFLLNTSSRRREQTFCDSFR